MVCESCEKKGKLTVLANPDKWKEGSKNNVGTGGVIKAGKSNKLLQKANQQWIGKDFHCRICKQKTQLNYNFCNNCAHTKGICSMCGKKVVESSVLKSLKMSLT